MGRTKILIVEDDHITVLHLQEMLKFRGYLVIAAVASGAEAVEAAMRDRPDLILMDVILEGDMDGIDAAMKIQSRLDIPVVYLTASTDERNLKRAQETEPYGYLLKPMTDYDLYSAIETALTRHRLEMKIRESEAFSSSLMDSMPVPVMVVNLDASIQYVNRAFESLTGFDSDDVVGLSPPYPWQMEERVDAGIGVYGGVVTGPPGKKKEEHLVKKSREGLVVEVTAVPVSRDGSLLYYLVSWEDITTRRYLEEQILDISERERIRVGRDLHDGIGQELTAIGYMLGVQANRIRNGLPPGQDEFEAVMQQLDQARTHVRLLAKGLSPVSVDKHGIAVALDELCRGAERIYGVSCTADCDDINIEDNSKATHIYYIIQESVNNAVKHGKSRTIRVMVKRRGPGLFISVVDDGTGLPAETGNQEGLGLMFMKYRAEIIGGVLNVNRRMPAGTIVTCMINRIE